MVGREQLINKLRELGYTYKRETRTTQLYRKGSHRTAVPKNAQLEETFVRVALRQCGCDDADIREFIRAAKA